MACMWQDLLVSCIGPRTNVAEVELEDILLKSAACGPATFGLRFHKIMIHDFAAFHLIFFLIVA